MKIQLNSVAYNCEPIEIEGYPSRKYIPGPKTVNFTFNVDDEGLTLLNKLAQALWLESKETK